jgi:hypothetical protein
MTLPPDVILFLIIVAGFFVIGLPLITKRVWMPERLDVEDVPESALEDRQRLYFNDLDAELSVSGYAPARTYRVTNLQGFNLVRTYLSPVAPEVVHAFLLRDEVEPGAPPTAMNYLEVSTRYADGTTASTRNGELSSVFPEPPSHELIVRRLVRRPGELVKAHRRRTEGHRIREPVHLRAVDLEQHIADFHHRWTSFQKARGRLKADPVGGVLRPTVKTGLVGIANYLNPLADNLTPFRLAAALVFGLGLPLAGVLLLNDWAGFSTTRAAAALGIQPGVLRWAGLALLFSVLGAVTGWLFESKAFIWTFLLAWLPLRIAGALALPTLGLSLWAGALAGWAADRRNRLRSLV